MTGRTIIDILGTGTYIPNIQRAQDTLLKQPLHVDEVKFRYARWASEDLQVNLTIFPSVKKFRWLVIIEDAANIPATYEMDLIQFLALVGNLGIPPLDWKLLERIE